MYRNGYLKFPKKDAWNRKNNTATILNLLQQGSGTYGSRANMDLLLTTFGSLAHRQILAETFS